MLETKAATRRNDRLRKTWEEKQGGSGSRIQREIDQQLGEQRNNGGSKASVRG